MGGGGLMPTTNDECFKPGSFTISLSRSRRITTELGIA